MMAANAPAHRPSVAARRVGYVIAVVLTAGFWYLANVWPGWRVLPFLTEDTGRVLTLVNLSLAVTLVANVLYLAYDGPSWRSFGDFVTTAFGLAVLVRFWQVFPFAFTGSFDWSSLVRVMLILAIVGSIVGMLVNLVALFGGRTKSAKAGTARRQVP